MVLCCVTLMEVNALCSGCFHGLSGCFNEIRGAPMFLSYVEEARWWASFRGGRFRGVFMGSRGAFMNLCARMCAFSRLTLSWCCHDYYLKGVSTVLMAFAWCGAFMTIKNITFIRVESHAFMMMPLWDIADRYGSALWSFFGG